MLKSRALSGAVVAGAIVAASIFAAAPASAATLPSGQQITIVDYSGWQFADANSETAERTPIGTGSPATDQFVTAVDVDDDGQGFALTTLYAEIDPVECDPEDVECIPSPGISEPVAAALRTADANTGTLGAGIPIQIETGTPEDSDLQNADECLALDYSGGVLIAACDIYGDGESAWIGTLDSTTAILTPQVVLTGDGFIQFQAIAVNPTNGEIWGFDADGEAFVITLDGSDPYNVGQAEMGIFAADFDRGGQLWVSAYREPEPAGKVIGPNENGLATLDLTTGNFPFSATWSDPAAVYDALTVWGSAPTLAKTGVAGSPAIALGATAILLFGATLAAGTAAMRRRSLQG